MDVSHILVTNSRQPDRSEKDDSVQLDPGLLAVTDLNTIDEESYNTDLEAHLLSLAQTGVQSLLGSLFSLPTTSSPDGPLAQLPPPIYQLPRAKPLPKPKAKTKWELFAAAKGIQKKTREKRVWDEEKQDWVNRWGRGGKNKEVEDQWITEVPMNADVDHDPRKAARDARKERVAKNDKQHLQNIARSQESSGPSSTREGRKQEINKTVAAARISTASMGKFDKQLEGEKKPRGVKRKFDPAEAPAEQEKQSSLALLSRMESDSKKMRKDPQADEKVLNVRKAVRFASKGKGGVALGRDVSGKKGKARTGRGKR
ncbi:RRS1-domain-containing protein [Pluteus cervinus]|uniref:RRS1-domain-containing protein n=1 Tax=Pluteus cervinus TaxID=181527 RepID=A0ACD3AFC9_9AGAR|nr:RRS1-domain-containing protein [Pluteus cervinus]